MIIFSPVGLIGNYVRKSGLGLFEFVFQPEREEI
jgi:hypothetical protein